MSSLIGFEKSGGAFLFKDAGAVVAIEEGPVLFIMGVGATPEMALFVIDEMALSQFLDHMPICRGGVADGAGAAADADYARAHYKLANGWSKRVGQTAP